MPPQGAPGGSGQLGTPRARPSHWAPRHRLGGSSEPPPKSPIPLAWTVQVATGRLLDVSGRAAAAAEIRDILPHAFAPATGLALAGAHAFGRYTTDGQEQVTLGCVELPPVQLRGAAVSAALRVRYEGPPTEGHLSMLSSKVLASAVLARPEPATGAPQPASEPPEPACSEG